jgi:hypothetical protein
MTRTKHKGKKIKHGFTPQNFHNIRNFVSGGGPGTVQEIRRKEIG